MAARRHESFPPWDEQVDLSDILQGEAGALLREYANIAPEKMEDHVKHIARKGWDVLRYPCFQKFLFLHFDLARSPLYRTILKLIQGGHLFVDLGCGLGQDLRALVRDGAPAENLVGLDLMHEYIDLGYELFQDREKLSSTFIAQDFFEDTPDIDNLARKAEIINSGYFMHLWTWGTQLNVAKRMIQLVAPERGAIILGVHFGSRAAGTWDAVPPGLSKMFLHNQETLSKLWEQAGAETQTVWEFQVVIEDDEYCKDLDPERCRLRWAAIRQ